MSDAEAKRIPYYRDKRADTLTRDELLEAYTYACDELERLRGWNREQAEMEALFAKTARALREGSHVRR